MTASMVGMGYANAIEYNDGVQANGVKKWYLVDTPIWS
jgi:hypothetical protein